MCEFASWKVYKDKVYFLQDSDLNTKEGRKLLHPEVIADLPGHGAIESYYPELKGKGENKECTDFSTPDNFPKEIAKAIKGGKITRFGIGKALLNNEGLAKYKKIEQAALAKYEKIRQSARAEYEKIRQPAWAEYEKIRQPALAEYEKIRQPAFWKIFAQKKFRNEAWR